LSRINNVKVENVTERIKNLITGLAHPGSFHDIAAFETVIELEKVLMHGFRV